MLCTHGVLRNGVRIRKLWNVRVHFVPYRMLKDNLLFFTTSTLSSIYPTLLELAVECAYPNDEALLMAIMFIASSVFGITAVHADDFLAREIDQERKKIVRNLGEKRYFVV